MKFKILFLFVAVSTFAFSATITTANDGNWSLPATWTGGVLPANGDDVEINHNITMDMNDRVRNVTINSSGTLDIATFRLRVDGSITNNGSFSSALSGMIQFRSAGFHNITGNFRLGRLQLNNAGAFVLVKDSIYIHNHVQLRGGILVTDAGSGGEIVLFSDGTDDGRIGRSDAGAIISEFTYMRAVNRSNEWGIYGMPFDASLADYASTTNGNMIYSGFSGGVNFPGFTWVNTYTYNEATAAGVYNNGFVTPGSTSDVISRGQGFWYYNTDQISGGGSVSYDQTWIWSMKGAIDLSEEFNFGITFTGSTGESGYNLIANPYPGTIDWDRDLHWTKTNVDNAVYYFRNSNQSAATYIGGTGVNGGSQNIPAGTGFWVQANAASPVLAVRQGALVGTNINLKSGENEDSDEEIIAQAPNELKISLGQDEIAIKLAEDATIEKDAKYDALKFSGGAQKLYSQYGQDAGHYAINTFPKEAISVPVFTNDNGVLSITGLETFDEDVVVRLEDKLTQEVITLYGDYEKTITKAQVGEFQNRFVVHFMPVVEGHETQNLSVGDLNVSYFDNVVNASYSLPQNISADYQIITVDGKVVSNGKLNGENGTIEIERLGQIQILKVSYNGQTLTHKIL